MLDLQELAVSHGSPLLLFSAETFRLRYQELQTALPQVKHHYALKALPYDECIRVIQHCDGHLDVASIGEINLVKATAPEMLARCIYTHPIKTKRDIELALEMGVQVMVADNRYELEKLLPYKNQVKLLLRVAFPNPEARCDLSAKFGATMAEVKNLIRFCLTNGIQLQGLSFHVGSQMIDTQSHIRAIQATRNLYDWCAEEYDLKLPILNIGGGFPARLDKSIPTITDFCQPIQTCLDELFPDTEIWSEPGRCLAADSMAAISQVIGKTVKNKRFWYYLNDGVYNTFSGKIYDHAEYVHEPLCKGNRAELFLSVLAGPTCDSIDVLKENMLLPEMEIGDFFLTKQVGAYCWASRTDFNQLEQTVIVNVDFDLVFLHESNTTLLPMQADSVLFPGNDPWPDEWCTHFLGQGGSTEFMPELAA